MKEIKDSILGADQLTYSPFIDLLKERNASKKQVFYTSFRHQGGSVPTDYFKPISLIPINFKDEKIL